MASAKPRDFIALTVGGLFIAIAYSSQYIVRYLMPAAFGRIIHLRLVRVDRLFASSGFGLFFQRGDKELHANDWTNPDVEEGRFYLVAMHPNDAEIILPIIDTDDNRVKGLLQSVDEPRRQYLLCEIEKFRAV